MEVISDSFFVDVAWSVYRTHTVTGLLYLLMMHVLA